MKQYKLLGTDLSVSRIALGCMNLWGRGNASLSEADIAQSADTLVKTALDLGINFFDHANIYGRGKSEAVFGTLLKANPKLRDRMIIQSKCGIRFRGDPNPDDPQRYDFSHRHITESVEASLKRLCTDHLDILLLHRPDPLCEPAEVARAFDELHKAGKVRHFGVSNHGEWQMELLKQHVKHRLVTNQLELSLTHNYLVDNGILVNQAGVPFPTSSGLLDYCRLNNVLVQAWSPVARGRIANPPPDATDRELRIAGVVAQLAQALHTNRDAITIAWLLRHPAGIQPILGTTNPQRLRDSAEADKIDLTHVQWWQLLAAARAGRVP
jgi:predicted oxidoreductase